MIKTYNNGNEFLRENKDFLDTNGYLAVFFYLDGPLLKESTKSNYAVKCCDQESVLLALKVEPYDLLLFGDTSCVPQLFSWLFDNGYEVKNYLCACEIGDAVSSFLSDKYGIEYTESLAMDFMEAKEITESSSSEVVHAALSDLDEICLCLEHFVVDCGLEDTVNREKEEKSIDNFRLIRADGNIVSFAKVSPSTDNSRKIGYVYTRDEYRGLGYARKVVNTLKNEILESGMTATLNVDRRNPISNHIYSSIGFKRVFSQGEYRRVKKTDMHNIKLVKLTPDYKEQLFDMISEWKADIEENNTNHSPWAIFKNDYRDFDYYLENLETKEEKDGKVPDSVFFCLDEDKNIFVGAVNIRHYLNDSLKITGGHIGDGIRPSERRKGYATAMMALALDECRKLGLKRVLVTCDKDNIGSAKTIMNNGGVLENEIINEEGVIEQRYWIDL